MKKLSILFCIVTVLTLQTTAQVVPVVRTNLTDILVGRYSLGTELFLQDQFSLGLDIVQEMHSWNSNHVLGRAMLYELTRHSDHHHRSHKKYQLLSCHEKSPQMPYGYPTSMLICLIPPLWFKLMNHRIPSEMKP